MDQSAQLQTDQFNTYVLSKKMIEINPVPNISRVVARVGLLPKISLITKARRNDPVRVSNVIIALVGDVAVTSIKASRSHRMFRCTPTNSPSDVYTMFR